MNALQSPDPIALFQDWFKDAEASEPNDPGAMTLATVDANGAPSARIVLLRAVDEKGFGFFTNRTSHKAEDITHNQNVALVLHWKSLLRQVRVEGNVREADNAISDAYFARRQRNSQIGAWASLQSQPLDHPETFQKRIADFTEKFAGQDVPRPPHWGGYIVEPRVIEFWQQRDFRLHERVVYTKTELGWTTRLLYP